MDKYKLTVGLEVHAELKTQTKMFCGCKNDSDEKRPNVNICPICLAHPGTLPVINKEAVRHVLKVGIAVGGRLADFSEFDRKNYFYPDIPKGYQISQYKYPLVSGGELNRVAITRIHLEEDTAKSTHEEGESSLVDFNRAGVPLMELVTEPVMHSAKEVVEFGMELQLLLQYLGVAEANMEKGELRLEANISISKDDTLGTKVEVKNLNSFRAAEKAIEYEVKRQAEVLESGGKVAQETRGWDDTKGETFSQRSKEDSHDYRYFPDPDLPKLKISEVEGMEVYSLQAEMPETHLQKRERFLSDYALKGSDVEFYIRNIPLSDLFEESARILKADYQLLSNYVVSDIAGATNIDIKPGYLADIIAMVSKAEVSSRGAKDILAEVLLSGKEPRMVAEEKGLFQKSDEGSLMEIIHKVIEGNPQVVAEFKGGKEASIQFLIGQAMKESKGSANPTVLKELFIKNLA